jgi:hypothetical protein
LTAEQVAGRWQVPPSQVYRLTREGALDGVVVRLGRYSRYVKTTMRYVHHVPKHDAAERFSRFVDGQLGVSPLSRAPAQDSAARSEPA